MIGPSGTLTMAALVLVFGAALVGLVRFCRWYVRGLLGAVAFLVAAVFGMSVVNSYYGYYDSWATLMADLNADNGASAAPAVFTQNGTRATLPATASGTTGARESGAWTVLRVPLPGPVSGVAHRGGVVVLPPGYADARLTDFPLVELLHGDPGGPATWTYGLHIADVLQHLAQAGRIGPEIVVLPTVQGVRGQQCLDDPRGDHLSTWLGVDVPRDITSTFPVAPPGRSWVVGGLSAGGYCAAALGLQHPSTWGGIAVMDGYFRPDLSASQAQRFFHGSQRAARETDAAWLLGHLPRSTRLPQFWIMSGTKNADDYRAAVAFGSQLVRREPFRLVTVVNGRHTMPAWRASLPDLLTWSWLEAHGRPASGDLVLRLS